MLLQRQGEHEEVHHGPLGAKRMDSGNELYFLSLKSLIHSQKHQKGGHDVMDKPINMTPQELAMWVIAGAIAFSVALEKLSKGAKIIISIIEQWRKPEKSQNDAISENRAKLEEHDKFLKSDNERIKKIEGWVMVSDELIHEHERAIQHQKDATESMRKYMGVQMNALLALLQAFNKLQPDTKIEEATKDILTFLSSEKMGGHNE